MLKNTLVAVLGRDCRADGTPLAVCVFVTNTAAQARAVEQLVVSLAEHAAAKAQAQQHETDLPTYQSLASGPAPGQSLHDVSDADGNSRRNGNHAANRKTATPPASPSKTVSKPAAIDSKQTAPVPLAMDCQPEGSAMGSVITSPVPQPLNTGSNRGSIRSVGSTTSSACSASLSAPAPALQQVAPTTKKPAATAAAAPTIGGDGSTSSSPARAAGIESPATTSNQLATREERRLAAQAALRRAAEEQAANRHIVEAALPPRKRTSVLLLQPMVDAEDMDNDPANLDNNETATDSDIPAEVTEATEAELEQRRETSLPKAPAHENETAPPVAEAQLETAATKERAVEKRAGLVIAMEPTLESETDTDGVVVAETDTDDVAAAEPAPAAVAQQPLQPEAAARQEPASESNGVAALPATTLHPPNDKAAKRKAAQEALKKAAAEQKRTGDGQPANKGDALAALLGPTGPADDIPVFTPATGGDDEANDVSLPLSLAVDDASWSRLQRTASAPTRRRDKPTAAASAHAAAPTAVLSTDSDAAEPPLRTLRRTNTDTNIQQRMSDTGPPVAPQALTVEGPAVAVVSLAGFVVCKEAPTLSSVCQCFNALAAAVARIQVDSATTNAAGAVDVVTHDQLRFVVSNQGVALRPAARDGAPALVVPSQDVLFWCVHPQDKKAFCLAFRPQHAVHISSLGDIDHQGCMVAVMRVAKKAHRLALALHRMRPTSPAVLSLGSSAEGSPPVSPSAVGTYTVTLLGDVELALKAQREGAVQACTLVCRAVPRPTMVTLQLGADAITLTSHDVGEVTTTLAPTHLQMAAVVDDLRVLKLLRRGGLAGWDEQLLVVAELISSTMSRCYVMQVCCVGNEMIC